MVGKEVTDEVSKGREGLKKGKGREKKDEGKNRENGVQNEGRERLKE